MLNVYFPLLPTVFSCSSFLSSSELPNFQHKNKAEQKNVVATQVLPKRASKAKFSFLHVNYYFLYEC